MALRRQIRYATVLVAFFGVSGTVVAQEEASVSVNLAVTTDYVFRGYTQTGEDAAVQGGLDWADSSGWYVGTWASNIDFGPGDDASIEVDIYGGYAWEANDVSYDVGLLYYAYPGADSSSGYDFIEAYAGLGYDLDAVSLSGAVHFTPDNFGETGTGWYLTGGLSGGLTDALSLDANVGFSQVTEDFGEDYLDWNVGLNYSFSQLALDLRYHDTDAPDCAGSCDARVVLSLSAGF